MMSQTNVYSNFHKVLDQANRQPANRNVHSKGTNTLPPMQWRQVILGQGSKRTSNKSHSARRTEKAKVVKKCAILHEKNDARGDSFFSRSRASVKF